MPSAQLLSTWRGVFGWLWPISVRMVCIMVPYLKFKKAEPSSASVEDDRTILVME